MSEEVWTGSLEGMSGSMSWSRSSDAVPGETEVEGGKGVRGGLVVGMFAEERD